jgi:uncharacterized protein
MKNLIGRESEIQTLKNALRSSQAELIAMYGRRRVGKTFLIRNVYEKDMVFEFTGIKDVSVSMQLENFALTMSNTFQTDIPVAIPSNWLQAFHLLIKFLEKRKSTTKKVIFFDEFPWIDAAKSNFLTSFDHFWNSWASKQNNLVIVICGSAASWMIQNIVSNKGGLHNRITQRIRLLPFNLYETELFLQNQRVMLDRYQIIQLYMVTGGIPHYLKELKPGESATQAIDRLCFTNDGLLRNEFENLYIALFDRAEKHISVIKALANKRSGLTRTELIEACKFSSGGSLTKLLDELLESGFILNYIPFDKTNKDSIYKLSDEYSLFYIKFIEKSKAMGSGTWVSKSASPSYKSWSGLAFENVFLKHPLQIKKALGIAGLYSEQSIWRYLPKDKKDNGTQIDLLIDRNDGCINLCEIKFSTTIFTIDKKYAAELQQKKMIFTAKTKTNKSIFITLLSTFGINENEHYWNTVQNQINMTSLFERL